MSDHYTVLGEIPDVKYEVTAESHSKIRTRNLKNIKSDNALKFLFILKQRLMKLDENNLNYTEQISRYILECIERFAPVTGIKTKENPTDWITNTIKNAITKRNQLFQNWTKSPSEINNQKYKKQRNLVTSLICNTKRGCNFEKLGPNLSSIFTKT